MRRIFNPPDESLEAFLYVPGLVSRSCSGLLLRVLECTVGSKLRTSRSTLRPDAMLILYGSPYVRALKILEPTFENGIWKGGKVDMPDGYYNLGERALNQFKKFPDFVGQIDRVTGTKVTYADMCDKSIRCALWLKEQGVSPGDVVAFGSRIHLDSCIPLYACLYIGAIFNLWWHIHLNEGLSLTILILDISSSLKIKL
ncbi:hypothetical protein KQX54_008003 [Cotesia glomerata]|uniref:AMP-dependent synthetase/ligase domain-containing protein n=1 Tax=Cotesia glomerata TaxID=32391 RepID=A0AAV7ILZ2_COTGL|nr:hypothetical protein KQX54_008003 [Cotesia glomerata]